LEFIGESITQFNTTLSEAKVAVGGPGENVSRATFDSPAALWKHCPKTYVKHLLLSIAAMSAVTR